MATLKKIAHAVLKRLQSPSLHPAEIWLLRIVVGLVAARLGFDASKI